MKLAAVEAAASQIAVELPKTPCLPSPHLSKATGADVWMKLENRQFTGSFKERGALVKLRSLDERAARRGVVAMSAGNHAQAVAYHAQRLGIPATIVMPMGTPFTKVRRTRAFGARVLLAGSNLAEGEQTARGLAENECLTLVHPYDDDAIVAANGTLALEMLHAQPALDTLIVPIGGGGLIAGIAIAAAAISPRIRVIGVQAARHPHMHRALQGLEPVAGTSTIADGIAVETQSSRALDAVRRLVSDIVLLSEEAIESAISALLEQEKLVVEGAGAAAAAALYVHADRFAGKTVGIVLTGGNIDPALLANVIMRTQLRDGLVARIRVEIADKPGALAEISALIAQLGANVMDLAHRRLFTDLSSKSADLDFTLELRDHDDLAVILQRLNETGFPAMLLRSHGRVEPKF